MFTVIVLYPVNMQKPYQPIIITSSTYYEWKESCYGIECGIDSIPLEDRTWNYHTWKCSRDLNYQQHFSFNLQTKQTNEWYGWSGGCFI